jgi:hypothetical protein
MFDNKRRRASFAWPVQNSHVRFHRVGDGRCDLRWQYALQTVIPYIELPESRMTIRCSARSILGSYCIRACENGSVWFVLRDFLLNDLVLMRERLNATAIDITHPPQR